MIASFKHAWVAAIGTAAAAAWPFANFFDANFSQLAIGAYGHLRDLAALCAVMVVLPICVAAVAPASVRPSVARALTTATVVIAAVFLSASIRDMGEIGGLSRTGAALFAGVVILGLAVLAWGTAKYEPFRFAVTVLGIVALTLPLSRVGPAWAALSWDTSTSQSTDSPSTVSTSFSGKNLYFLVLDGYGRADTLKDAGYDNSAFVQALEKRGFFVDQKALGNYSSTYVSIMAMLEADYVVDDKSPRYRDRSQFYPTALNNGRVPSVVYQFKASGYQTVRVSNEWGRCDESIFDHCFVEGGQELSYPMRLFLEATVLPQLFPRLATPPPEAIANDAVEIANQRFFEITSKEPFFLFAHELAPHAPFRYGPGCIARTPQPDDESSPKIARPLYLQMLPCVNRNVLHLIDRIVGSDPDGLIILASDHGTDFQVDWHQRLEEWPLAAQIERFSILSASRLPEGCKGYHQPGIGQINLMRIALACLEGQAPNLVHEASFITVYENSTEFGRVVQADVN